MRISLFLALLLLPICVYAQERVSVRARIVNEKGEAIAVKGLENQKPGFNRVGPTLV